MDINTFYSLPTIETLSNIQEFLFYNNHHPLFPELHPSWHNPATIKNIKNQTRIKIEIKKNNIYRKGTYFERKVWEYAVLTLDDVPFGFIRNNVNDSKHNYPIRVITDWDLYHDALWYYYSFIKDNNFITNPLPYTGPNYIEVRKVNLIHNDYPQYPEEVNVTDIDLNKVTEMLTNVFS